MFLVISRRNLSQHWKWICVMISVQLCAEKWMSWNLEILETFIVWLSSTNERCAVFFLLERLIDVALGVISSLIFIKKIQKQGF